MVDVAPAPALPTLPHSLVHEVCHYLWPADVARLADTCRSLGVREEEEEVSCVIESDGVVWSGMAWLD